jgi:hypothetical protein
MVSYGDPVDLLGAAIDAEDGDLTDSAAWTSDLDGVLGSGGNLTRSDLSEGTHLLALDVTDSGGSSGHAEVVLVVPEPGVAPTLLAGLSLLWLLRRPAFRAGARTSTRPSDRLPS